MIRAENIGVKLSGRSILHGIDFSADAGGLVAIVGPNGAGKTTLVKALTGELPYSGFASINGLDVCAAKPWQLAAIRAVLPQATTLAFPFTVREIVALGFTSGVAGDKVHADNELIDAALQQVDLSGFAGRFYQQLSGGEKQRVQLARVLCQIWEPVLDGEPRWLFLDEPVASLDIRHQLTIMQVAKDFAERGGGVVAVMHDLNLGAMFAEQICVVSDGQIAAYGAPDQVISNDMLLNVFGCDLRVNELPDCRIPFVLPHTTTV